MEKGMGQSPTATQLEGCVKSQAARQTRMLPHGLTLAFLLQTLSVVQVIIVGPYLAILLFLFLIPLGMYSPCIREMGTLGPRPALIGHRGAPMVGLEQLFYIVSSSCVLLPSSSIFFSMKPVEGGRGDISVWNCMPKASLHGFANKDNTAPEGQDGFGG